MYVWERFKVEGFLNIIFKWVFNLGVLREECQLTGLFWDFIGRVRIYYESLKLKYMLLVGGWVNKFGRIWRLGSILYYFCRLELKFRDFNENY